MDLKTELLQTSKKKDVERIANEVTQCEKLFKELISLFLEGEYRVSQKASWVLTHCSDKDKSILKPYLNEVIIKLKEAKNNTVKRNTVRILQSIEIPEELEGDVTDVCFRYLEANEAIAVKVFSMTVLSNLVKKYPELKNELKIAIEDQLPYSSPAFRNRGVKILKALT